MTASTPTHHGFDDPLADCKTTLTYRSLLVLAAAIALGLSRILATGWFLVDLAHLAIAALAVAGWFYREALPARPLAAGVILLISCYAVSNLMQFGFLSSGLPLFLAAGFLCALLFGLTATLVYAVLATLGSVFAGFLYYQMSSADIWASQSEGARYLAWTAISIGSLLFIPVLAEYLARSQSRVRELLDQKPKSAPVVEKHSGYDTLTGLPQLQVALDRLRHELNRAKRGDKLGAVMMIDVDDFSEINNRYGKAGGDQVLRALAARISSITRACDILARVGGDEFIAVFADQADEDRVRLIARKLLATVNTPIVFDQHTIDLRVSIGIALYPEHSVNPRELVGLASQALALVKESGGHNFRLVSTEL